VKEVGLVIDDFVDGFSGGDADLPPSSRTGPKLAQNAMRDGASPRSNSYNFVPVRDVRRAPGAPCPVRASGGVARDGGRSMLVRLRDRMRIVHTSTQDFSAAELRSTLAELGQIYADVSTKLAPDDFAKDLRKLRRSAECAACPEEPRCAGAWEAVADDPWSRDDALVRAILGGLSGRVLDVGGGDAVYLDALAGAVTSAHVEYVCVDPDAGRLRVLETRWADVLGARARFVVGRAETMGPELGAFDHALFLRSWNHLRDPALATRRALARLAPGGGLIVVDNVAFGLVRGARHARAAEAAPGNLLEHYRNDGAADADAVIQAAAREVGAPLRLVERRDVGPETSNQWLLRYQ
jgi:SAM-dependent methyltransferase